MPQYIFTVIVLALIPDTDALWLMAYDTCRKRRMRY